MKIIQFLNIGSSRFIVLTIVSLFFMHNAVMALDNNAEEDFRQLYGDVEMISIATGSQQPISKAPAVASVITAKDIKLLGATDLDEVLETVPGLHVARSSIGFTPIYSIRGIYSAFNPQVLVMINGIPISNIYTGNRSQVWGGMPVEAIKRIEVIRGPGSAIYGADAFAGVINIITKTGDDINGSEIGVRMGSFNTRDMWALHGGSWKGFDIAFVLEYHGTDGQSETIDTDLQTSLDSSLGTNVSLAPGSVSMSRENLDLRLDIARDNWRLRAGLQSRKNYGVGAGVAQALDPHGRMSSERLNLDLTYHDPYFSKNWDVQAQLSYLDTSMEVERDLLLLPPGAVLPVGSDGNINFVSPVGLVLFTDGYIGNPEVFERHYRLNTSAQFTGFDHHALRLGAGFGLSDLYKVNATQNYGPGVIDGTVSPVDGSLTDVSDTPNVFLQEGMRENYYVFAQDVWAFYSDLEMTTGVRYDHFSDFGDTVNPRLSLVWSMSHSLTSKLLYGHAFRAPAFAETRVKNNPTGLGNPDLDPETIETIELAFNYKPVTALHYSLSLFRYQWKDIILFVPDSGATTRTAQNAGSQTGYGLEFEFKWKPVREFSLFGNYSYQKSKDEITNKDSGNSPQQQVFLQAQWSFLPDWDFSTQLNWVIDRQRPPGDNRSDIDDYQTVDITLRRKKIKKSWEVAFTVRNLFDVDVREPSLSGNPAAAIPNDLPMAGRSIAAEVRFQF